MSLLSIFEEFNIDCLNIPFSTKRITITNFCLGKHLIRDNDLLKDQRGSPAYISPDVLSGEWNCFINTSLWSLRSSFCGQNNWCSWLDAMTLGWKYLASKNYDLTKISHCLDYIVQTSLVHVSFTRINSL